MSESIETIQEIAYKLMLEQNKNEVILSGPMERTTFVLGSKGVVSKEFGTSWKFLEGEHFLLGQIDFDQQLS
jgi:hypothetical protein